MMRIATLVLLATSVFPAVAQESNPILGAWDWNPTHGVCHEVHVYRSDGTAQTKSGTEVLEKTFTIAPGKGGMYVVSTKVVSANDGRDCLGSKTAVGATSVVFIQPLNSGSYFTCANEDGMSCYGSAQRAAKPD